MEKANLSKSIVFNITKEELFKNIEKAWIKLGRQPRFIEMKKPVSTYSIRPYITTFGSWQNALEAFVDYMNQEKEENGNSANSILNKKKSDNIKTRLQKRTKREISERLRFRILVRDGFTCKKCGRSPLKTPGVELHVDHIIPWSRGGESLPENLETKCRECNLGKGNIFYV